MNSLNYDIRDLLTAAKFLALLPGVKPRVTLDEIAREHFLAVENERDTFNIYGKELSTSQYDACFLDNIWGSRCITPFGASLLIDLYREGQLPMKTKSPGEIPEKAVAYSKGTELQAKAAERKAKNDTRNAKIDNPDTATEEDFNTQLLGGIFWKHLGPGQGTLKIGGIDVQKSITRYRSNSGKSHDFSVTYSWVSPKTGEKRTLEKPSDFMSNRRSDPCRNWGLGRD